MQQQWNYRVELTSYNSDISFNIQYCEYATHLLVCPDPEIIPDTVKPYSGYNSTQKLIMKCVRGENMFSFIDKRSAKDRKFWLQSGIFSFAEEFSGTNIEHFL